MSNAQFTRIKNKYAKTELHFTNYYKYTFYYKGVTTDGKEIEITNFGDSADIYRADLTPTMTLEKLCYELPVDYIKVGNKEYESDD